MDRRSFLTTLVAFGSGTVLGIFLPRRARVPGKSGRPSGRIIVGGHCAACGGCVASCPEQAIEFPYPALKIDEALCTRCGNCVRVCPVEAITLT